MPSVIDQLNQIVQQAHWPSEHRMTMQSRRIYEDGLDMVHMFRGDFNIFVEALRLFQATHSCAYAYAGIAYTFSMASYGFGGDRAQYGQERAFYWLEKSQTLEPDRPEINFIEAAIYINRGKFDNARLILDYLYEQDPKGYYLCFTEMSYWHEQNNESRYMHWAKQALAVAGSELRRLLVMNALAGFYAEQGKHQQAIKLYHQVTQLDPNDPWAWHNLSVMFLRLEQYKEADQCNKRALSLMDFSAARRIEQEIKKNRGGLSRLFGW